MFVEMSTQWKQDKVCKKTVIFKLNPLLRDGFKIDILLLKTMFGKNYISKNYTWFYSLF